MTEAIYPEEQVISEFTLAFLEDIEYYKANSFTGGLIQFGKHKGCDFLKQKCFGNTVNLNYYNVFLKIISNQDVLQGDKIEHIMHFIYTIPSLQTINTIVMNNLEEENQQTFILYHKNIMKNQIITII